MDPALMFQNLGISVLLGLLVGLQREHAESSIAGMRTFPLITLLGTVSGILAMQFGGWLIVGGLAGVTAVVTVGHLLKLRREDPDVGNTTNMAMLLMFLVGALLVVEGAQLVAVAIGGGVAVLLQYKPELHYVAKKLGDEDLRAIMQFVLITCIILPVLPNKTYGPLDVFNPRETWLMVVLIVGMSLGGYIVYKFFGHGAGILLGGVMGGIISSTATTVSYSRQARSGATAARTSAIVVLIASTIVYVRVLVEIAVVSPAFFRTAAGPIGILMGLTLLPAVALWFRVSGQTAEMPKQENPTQLKSAVVFGLMYAIVLFALAAATEYRHYIGGEGVYVVAAISGLTDMDAITLATARESLENPRIAADGWRLIVMAALSNLVFKAGIAGILGGRQLLRRIAVLFSIPMVGGIVMLVLL